MEEPELSSDADGAEPARMASVLPSSSCCNEEELEQLLQEDARCRHRFETALRKYVDVYAKRKARFERVSVLQHEERQHDSEEGPTLQQSRMFILSENEDPWNVFATRTHSLLEMKRFVFEWSGVHFTSLHSACAAGDVDCARSLLRYTPRSGLGPSIEQRHELQQGKGDQRRWQLQRPCTLARDSSGRTPLHHAVMRERHRVIRLLLRRQDAALQVHTRDNAQYTPVHYALFKMHTLAHRASFPQEERSRNNNSASTAAALHLQLRRGSRRYRRLWQLTDTMVAMVVSPAVLHEKSALDADYCLHDADLRCRGDLWDACRSGDLARLRFLVQAYYQQQKHQGRDDWCMLRHLNRSLLHEACDQQHLSIVNYLVTELRVSVHIQDASGCTALHYAAMRGFVEGCVLLLADNDDGEALCLCADARGRTPLHWSLLSSSSQPSSLSSSRTATAKYLARHCISALHVRDCDGFTALHIAISRGDSEMVRELVHLGADVNASGSIPYDQMDPRDHASPTTSIAETMTSGVGSKVQSKMKAPWAPCGLRLQRKRSKTRLSKKKREEESGIAEYPDVIDMDSIPVNRSEVGNATDDGGEQGALHTKEEDETTTNEATTGGESASMASELCTGAMEQRDKNPQDIDTDAKEFESLVGMDTFWYWVHKKETKMHTTNKNASTDSMHERVEPALAPKRSASTSQQSSTDVMVDASFRGDGEDAHAAAEGEVPLGCRKYGGRCSECCRQGDEVHGVSDSPRTRSDRVLSPLVLAIRVCKRANHRETQLEIVELLLLAGANPDGDPEVDARQAPVTEALYVAKGCSQLVSTLLLHGAKRICWKEVERYCFSVASSPSMGSIANLEVVLLHVMETLDTVRGAPEHSPSCSSLAATFFATRCFNVVAKLPHHFLSLSRLQYGGLWKAIRLGLSATTRRRNATMVVDSRLTIDRDHLCFLSKQIECHLQSNHENVSSDYELGMLLHDCIAICLQKWRAQAPQFAPVTDAEHAARQRLLSKCLQQLILHPRENPVNEHEAAATNMKDSVAAATPPAVDHLTEWLDDCIALEFFECARLLFDELTSTRRSSISIDQLLVAYGAMLTTRHHDADEEHRHRRREFLIALLERCMEVAKSTTQVVRASMVSVVRCCAYNLPLALIQQVVHLARKYHDHPCTFDARVDGKTLPEWLVHHQRKDAIQFLVLTMANTSSSVAQHGRTVLWRELVGAAAATERKHAHESECKREFLRGLCSLYVSSLQQGSSEADRSLEELLEWLVLQRAVRCDSPALFSCVIVPLWETLHPIAACGDDTQDAAAPAGSANEQEGCRDKTLLLFAALHKKMDCFHAFAKWNSLRLATYFVREHFAPHSTSVDAKHWNEALRDSITAHEDDDDGCTPLELCYLLGHVRLAQLLLSASGGDDDDAHAVESQELPPTAVKVDGEQLNQDAAHVYGIFQAVLSSHSKHTTSPNRDTLDLHAPMQRQRQVSNSVDHRQSLQGDWRAACVWNLVPHLEALGLHRVPMLPHVHTLLLTSIQFGSLDALEWLLVHKSSLLLAASHEEDADGIRMLYDAASKHPSDLYARMTLLLLTNNIPYTGRLAGDGNDTTLLHRCVCFSNAHLMQQIVEHLLKLPGCEINVRDAFGNSPFVYACLAGNLATLCFLVQKQRARLESFEETQSSEAGAAAAVGMCGFCGHAAEHHRVVPHPPWFLDQYETYLGVKSKENEADADDQEGESWCSRAMETERVEESVLEDQRGRLNASMLLQIAKARYAHVLEEFALSPSSSPEDEGSDARFSHTTLAIDLESSSNLHPEQEDSNDGFLESSWEMFPLHMLVDQEEEREAQDGNASHTESGCDGERDDKGADDVSRSATWIPWYLQRELLALHPHSCECHDRRVITTKTMWKYKIIATWLRHAAQCAQRERCAAATARSTTGAHSTPLLHGMLPPAFAQQIAFARWRKRVTEARAAGNRAHAVTAKQRTRLRRFLAHWRFANVFVALQHWKHECESPQVQHHKVESVLDDMVAQMRHVRFTTLQERHKQLEKSIARTMQWDE